MQAMFAGLYFDAKNHLRKVAAHNTFDRLLDLVKTLSIVKQPVYDPVSIMSYIFHYPISYSYPLYNFDHFSLSDKPILPIQMQEIS